MPNLDHMDAMEYLEVALGYVEMLLDHIDCDHGGDHPARDEIKNFLDRMNALKEETK